MTILADEPEDGVPTNSSSLGRSASAGAIWFAGQAICLKVISFFQTVILTRLLSREQFGLAQIAFSLVSIPSLIQSTGTSELLVQRAARIERWTNAAFWMSLAMGGAATLTVFGMAPAAAVWYHDHRIIGLLAILGTGCTIGSLILVPHAQLQLQLRFRFLAVFGFVTSLLQIALTVLMALRGYGVLSLVIPIVLQTACRAAVYWWVARPRVRLRLDLHRWGPMFRDRGMLLGAAVGAMLISQGDYLILGRIRGNDVVGLYSWAFNLSFQAVALLSGNITVVLLPTLARIQGEQERFRAAVLRAARVLVGVGTYACVLQGVLAAPGVRLLFSPEWHAGIPIIEILSLGMAFQMALLPCVSGLTAQGRFRGLFLMYAGSAACFLVLVYAGAQGTAGVASATAVAWMVSLYHFVATPIWLLFALRSTRVSLVWRVSGVPLSAGALSGAAAWCAVAFLPHSRLYDGLALVIGTATVSTVYLLLIRWWDGPLWDDLRVQWANLLARISRGRASAAA